jgi:hypothetical protein
MGRTRHPQPTELGKNKSTIYNTFSHIEKTTLQDNTTTKSPAKATIIIEWTCFFEILCSPPQNHIGQGRK